MMLINCSSYPWEDNDPYLWRILQSIGMPIAHEVLNLHGQVLGLFNFIVPNHNSCFLRARLSAATKIVVNAIFLGALLPNNITIQYTTYYCYTHSVSPTSSSISAFTNLVDVLEASFLELQGLASHVIKASPPLQTYPNLGFKVWRLNENGHINFMKILEYVAAQEIQFIIAKGSSLFGYNELHFLCCNIFQVIHESDMTILIQPPNFESQAKISLRRRQNFEYMRSQTLQFHIKEASRASTSFLNVLVEYEAEPPLQVEQQQLGVYQIVMWLGQKALEKMTSTTVLVVADKRAAWREQELWFDTKKRESSIWCPYRVTISCAMGSVIEYSITHRFGL